MAFKELVSPTLTDLFVEEMERMILSGELKAGEKLPTERALADQMKVSLAVINAGISRLASKNFLNIIPRKGVYVADYIREGNIDTLEVILKYYDHYYRPDLLEALVDFRRHTEIKIVEHAAMNRTEENVRNLEELYTGFCTADNAGTMSELGFCFHHECSLACGNMVYPFIVMAFKPIYLSSYNRILSVDSKEPLENTLKKLLDSIRTQNSTDAVQALTESIEYWKHIFETHFSKGEKFYPGSVFPA